MVSPVLGGGIWRAYRGLLIQRILRMPALRWLVTVQSLRVSLAEHDALSSRPRPLRTIFREAAANPTHRALTDDVGQTTYRTAAAALEVGADELSSCSVERAGADTSLQEHTDHPSIRKELPRRRIRL